MTQLSIRARITIGSVIVAAVIFTTALVGVRFQVGQILEGSDESLARSDLASFSLDIAANPDEPVDDPGTGVLVYVVSPSRVAQVDTMPHDIHELLERRTPADEQFETEVGGEHFVVVGMTVDTELGTWGLWSARSTQSTEVALESLDALVLIGGVVLLIAFGIASWLLASAALRPVVRLQRGAERLAMTASGASLPVGGANDEIAQLARTLNQFLDDVRESADREKRMVSDAAHELRTPLAALKTQLEIARADSADARTAGQLVSAEKSVDRLSALATNLLELARLEQPDFAAQRATADEIADELLAAVDRARLLAVRNGIEVDYRVGDCSGSISTSATSFGRICDNLLANAVTAAAHSVTVSLDARGDDVELTVADDGGGMPDDFIDHAFERFSRSDSARTGGGAGLGLALVRAIADAAGGTVTLRNTRPGLAAVVRLPKM